MNIDTIANLIAGGIGGTAGAIFTCPLEVVKTRLQSSTSMQKQKPSSICESASPHPPHEPPTSSSSLIGRLRTRLTNRKAGNANSVVFGSNANIVDLAPEKTSNATGCATPSSNQSAWRSFNQSKRIFSANSHFFEQFRHANRKSYYQTFDGSAKANAGASESAGNFRTMGLFKHLKSIVAHEGTSALWKGLGPTVVGVAPSRAIYFSAYSNAKVQLNQFLVPETPIVHMLSAAFAGFSSSTLTNPIWVVRTRLQLDRMSGSQKLTIYKCMRQIYQQDSFKGFYKGVTASYVGISETIIHFVIYEYLKSSATSKRGQNGERSAVHFMQYMMCAGVSRLIATTVAYPHEVLRTRLREEGKKYKWLLQSFLLILREETWRGLYSGLSIHLLRSVPNTAVTMATYELVVYMLLNSAST